MPDIDDADKPGADNDTALKKGMDEKATEFVKKGAEMYHRA